MAAAISANTSAMGRVSDASALFPVAGYTRTRSFWPEKLGIWATISSQVPSRSSNGVVMVVLQLVLYPSRSLSLPQRNDELNGHNSYEPSVECLPDGRLKKTWQSYKIEVP